MYYLLHLYQLYAHFSLSQDIFAPYFLELFDIYKYLFVQMMFIQ